MAAETKQYETTDFTISTDQARLDFDFICRSLHTTRWAKNRPDPVIVESFRNSLCFGVFANSTGEQVGFARVVTDQVASSLIADVFIAEPLRRRGIGQWLMSCVVAHPHVARTKSRLGTADAHGFYAKFGYEREEVMRRRPTQVPP
jgi:GNAT superfamily N-acetyltransferase